MRLGHWPKFRAFLLVNTMCWNDGRGSLPALVGRGSLFDLTEVFMCEDYEGLDWDDWMIIGPLSEEIAEERRERRRIERDLFEDDDELTP